MLSINCHVCYERLWFESSKDVTHEWEAERNVLFSWLNRKALDCLKKKRICYAMQPSPQSTSGAIISSLSYLTVVKMCTNTLFYR